MYMSVFDGKCEFCNAKAIVSFSYIYEYSLFIDTINVFSHKQISKNKIELNNNIIISSHSDQLFYGKNKIIDVKYTCYCENDIKTVTTLLPNQHKKILKIKTIFEKYIIEYDLNTQVFSIYSSSGSFLQDGKVDSFECFKLFANEQTIDSYVFLK